MSTEEAQNLADEHGVRAVLCCAAVCCVLCPVGCLCAVLRMLGVCQIHYFSTSAATGTNVQELITFVAQVPDLLLSTH